MSAETSTHAMLQADHMAVAYFPSTGIAFTTNARIGAAQGSPGSKQVPNTTTPILPLQGEDGALSNEIAQWGLNNDLPTQIMRDVEANPELASTLDWSAKAIISGGLVYGYVKTDPATGRETMEVVSDPEVDEWLETTNIKKYLRHISKDMHCLYHGFTEFMFNDDRSKIAAIACQDTSHCRYGLQDQETGRIKFGYVCADWTLATSASSEYVKKFPLIDPDYGVQLQLQYGKFKRCLYPTSGTATGRTYYQPAPWHSLRTSGWLELANAIPKFKRALLKNQFTIKYHVQIPDWWWKLKYPDWEEFPLKKRDRVQAELDAFNAKMAGTDNAGNSIMTMFKTDEEGRAYDGWKIEPIKDNLQDGKYIEDSQEACSHIFFGVGVDPTLIGAAPGKTFSSGSGSDKRVAQNIWILNSKTMQDILLEPIEAAFLFNKYGANGTKRRYDIWFRTYLVQTLDNGSPASKDKPGKKDKIAA